MTANDLRYGELLHTRQQDRRKLDQQKLEHRENLAIKDREIRLKEESQPYTLEKTQAETEQNLAKAKRYLADASLGQAKEDQIYSTIGPAATRNQREAQTGLGRLASDVIWGVQAATDTVSKLTKLLK